TEQRGARHGFRSGLPLSSRRSGRPRRSHRSTPRCPGPAQRSEPARRRVGAAARLTPVDAQSGAGLRDRAAARRHPSAARRNTEVRRAARRCLMLGWLGRAALVWRRLILAASAVVLVVAVLVLRHGGSLSSGATEGIESDTAQRLVERELAYPGDSSFMILFTSGTRTVDD